MLSVMEVKKRLPKEFIENLYELHSPLVADKILAGMAGKRNTTLRVNTLKYNIFDIKRCFSEIIIQLERVNMYCKASRTRKDNEEQCIN